MQSYSDWSPERATAMISAHNDLEGPVLPVLHALQREFGYIRDEAILLIADAFNLTRAEVHGVVSFYHDFKREPHGRHVLKLCRAEACQSMGGDALAEHVKARLGADWGETAKNGAITLEPVFCLGFCACAPSALLDGEPLARLNEARIGAVLDSIGC